ncbi:MAG: TetR/AcrR family transcriptional regulator [Syntrophaceae bacterium]|jgi:AcrR family transcriptional regulator|nr:TetR/AcrR family transcriptional regulator [Syntrophaceae bacterium]
MNYKNNAGIRERKRPAYRKPRYIPLEQRRQDIVNAAAEIFGEKGFHKAKIGDIAKRAGIAHGTVYRYFPNKQALAIEIIGSRGATGFLSSLRQDSLKEMELERLLKNIAEKYIGNLEQRLPIIRFQMAEALSSPVFGKHYYQGLLHRLFVEMDGVFNKYQKKGYLKKGNTFIYGHIFYGALFSFLYCQELLYGKEVSRIEVYKIIPEIIDVFLHGVASSEKSRINIRKRECGLECPPAVRQRRLG